MNILFMCVANSARSQIAEGLARKMLPKSIGIFSAGSKPTRINPYAIVVMKEIGVDISKHVSKTVDAIETEKITKVVTLCAEEVCPAFLGNVERLHWPIKDPAGVKGTEEEILAAFRSVRDEIAKKIENMA